MGFFSAVDRSIAFFKSLSQVKDLSITHLQRLCPSYKNSIGMDITKGKEILEPPEAISCLQQDTYCPAEEDKFQHHRIGFWSFDTAETV